MSFVDHASCEIICLLYCSYVNFTGILQVFHKFINVWYAVFIAVEMARGDEKLFNKRGDKFINMKGTHGRKSCTELLVYGYKTNLSFLKVHPQILRINY